MRTKIEPAPRWRICAVTCGACDPIVGMCFAAWWELGAAVIFAAVEAGICSGELRVAAEKLQQLLSELQQQGAVVSGDLRDALEVALGKLPLVSQREFDIQAAKLARAEEKLAHLEQQLKALEEQLEDKN
ncbi:accessory factor UbiK family protein [Microbulbifer sp. SH-1]|uniref:accessory factor UbiK family protein n=1 Tax=Microbulbifer sp. SH-1 TaxID=2681547 RepID=UPI001F0EDE9D|nr:accessory factor UbiK family protein [Microbulbifer sp. SH-1]